MSHSVLIEDIEAPEAHTKSRESIRVEREPLAITPRRSNPASFVRAQAFSRMNKEEQRSFIALRFQQLDAQELVNIFKAVYGRPADKGRPRSKG